jgi:hypothetical protein
VNVSSINNSFIPFGQCDVRHITRYADWSFAHSGVPFMSRPLVCGLLGHTPFHAIHTDIRRTLAQLLPRHHAGTGAFGL